MAKDKKIAAADFAADDSGGWVTRFLADEDSFDRRMLWRLGSWATAAVGAVTIAVLANQSTMRVPRDQVASDVASQSRQIQRIAGEVQVESKRLTSALETLNTDHDRLYSRITKVEEGLDSITGSIARQTATPAGSTATPSAPKDRPPQHHAMESRTTTTTTPADTEPISNKPQATAAVKPEPAKSEKIATPVVPAAPTTALPQVTTPEPTPIVAAVSTPAISTPPTPATPDTTATKSPPSAPTAQSEPTPNTTSDSRRTFATLDTAAVPEIPVQRTAFGVDLGGANSIEGLRTLWRRVGAANKELNGLSPIIAVQERHDTGRVHLRLVAGPFDDAAAAAKICAVLATRRQACETSVFDGQRLALNAEPSVVAPTPRAPRRRSAPHTANREPPKPPAQPAPAPATPPTPAR